MALTINAFLGAETGTIDELTVGGGITADATIKYGTGAYSYKHLGLTAGIEYQPFKTIASGGSGIIIGHALRTPSTTGTTALLIFRLFDGNSASDFDCVLQPDGYVRLRDNAGATTITSLAPLAANTWYFIEAYVERTNTGAAALFIDMLLQGTASGQDFLGPAVAPMRIASYSENSTSVAWYLDDMYFMSGATAASQRLGSVKILPYRNATNAVTADAGSNLDSGTWLGAQAIPWSDAAVATYSTSALGGSINTDEAGGSAGTGGPLTDRNCTRRILAVKGCWRALRGGGAGSNHYGLLGNNVDGTTRSAAMALSTSYEYREMISELSTIVPTADEIGRIGFETDSGQDITVADMLFQVLVQYVPAPMPTYIQNKKIRHLLMR